MKGGPVLSIIVPVFNEAAVLPAFLKRLEDTLAEMPGAKQILLVDDGSTDETRSVLRTWMSVNPQGAAVFLSRNFGHQRALCAGLAFSKGDVVVMIDGDLQDPPEVIPDLVAAVREGFDVVHAVRRRRRESLPLRMCYWLFYRLLRLLSQYSIPLDAGDFSAMSRRVVDILNHMPEQDRFLRGMRAWVGFRQKTLEYDRGIRAAGYSKYTLSRLMRLALDGVLSSSDKPLRLATVAGMTVSSLSFLFGAYTVAWRLFARGSDLPGYASIAAGIFFLGGIQLITTGILGEYVARVFNQVRARPLYIVAETHNLAKGPASPSY